MKETKFDSLHTRCIALGRALSKDDRMILEHIQNEGEKRTFELLLSYRRAAYVRYGEWMRDYIDLRSYVETVNICKANPNEQRKAHARLLSFIDGKHAMKNGFAAWQLPVKDSAFGEMLLYEGGENIE